MKFMWQCILFVCLCQLQPSFCCAAAGEAMPDKSQLQSLLHAICGVGECDKVLNPHNPQDADEIISHGAYIVYNRDYDKLEKYNAKLKARRGEGELLVPAKWVDDAVCKYYGFDLTNYPELNKAAKKLFKNGHFTVGASDPGIADFEIEKMKLLKNGTLRASGKMEGEDPFVAYFGISNCGGKPHWAPIRVVYTNPTEESEQFQNQFN